MSKNYSTSSKNLKQTPEVRASEEHARLRHSACQRRKTNEVRWAKASTQMDRVSVIRSPAKLDSEQRSRARFRPGQNNTRLREGRASHEQPQLGSCSRLLH